MGDGSFPSIDLEKIIDSIAAGIADFSKDNGFSGNSPRLPELDLGNLEISDVCQSKIVETYKAGILKFSESLSYYSAILIEFPSEVDNQVVYENSKKLVSCIKFLAKFDMPENEAYVPLFAYLENLNSDILRPSEDSDELFEAFEQLNSYPEFALSGKISESGTKIVDDLIKTAERLRKAEDANRKYFDGFSFGKVSLNGINKKDEEPFAAIRENIAVIAENLKAVYHNTFAGSIENSRKSVMNAYEALRSYAVETTTTITNINHKSQWNIPYVRTTLEELNQTYSVIEKILDLNKSLVTIGEYLGLGDKGLDKKYRTALKKLEGKINRINDRAKGAYKSFQQLVCELREEISSFENRQSSFNLQERRATIDGINKKYGETNESRYLKNDLQHPSIGNQIEIGTIPPELEKRYKTITDTPGILKRLTGVFV